MADVHDKATRSYNMSRIKSRDTKPEILVSEFLKLLKIPISQHVKSLPGRPDIVIKECKTIIFLHGCFWHNHSCDYFRWPKTRRKWWKDKISRNQKKDSKSIRALRKNGWSILTVWECRLRPKSLNSSLVRIISKISSNASG